MEKLAWEIIEKVMAENACKWYEAVEDFGAYDLMKQAGVAQDVIDEICENI
jgi:hypothetical protein